MAIRSDPHGTAVEPGDRVWSRVRFVLGSLQMFGSVLALTLLATVGVTAMSLGVVVVTTLITTISVVLFGSRRSRLMPSGRATRP